MNRKPASTEPETLYTLREIGAAGILSRAGFNPAEPVDLEAALDRCRWYYRGMIYSQTETARTAYRLTGSVKYAAEIWNAGPEKCECYAVSCDRDDRGAWLSDYETAGLGWFQYDTDDRDELNQFFWEILVGIQGKTDSPTEAELDELSRR